MARAAHATRRGQLVVAVLVALVWMREIRERREVRLLVRGAVGEQRRRTVGGEARAHQRQRDTGDRAELDRDDVVGDAPAVGEAGGVADEEPPSSPCILPRCRLAVAHTPMTDLGSITFSGTELPRVSSVFGTCNAMVWTLKPLVPSFPSIAGSGRRWRFPNGRRAPRSKI